MKRNTLPIVAGLVVALLAGMLPATAGTPIEEKFPLVRAVPDDVFLCVTGMRNPERKFLDDYWGEVFQTLIDAGVADEVMGLFTAMLDTEQMEEVERLRTLAMERFGAIDWNELFGRETVFAERLNGPQTTSGGGLYMGPPDMVWIMGSQGDLADEHFAGLVALLETFVDEINTLAGGPRFAIERSQMAGADVAAVNFTKNVPGAPPITIAFAKRGEILLASFGREILEESLALLAGDSTKRPICADPRFIAAFEKLPEPEDAIVFFDMKGMMRPMHALFSQAAESMSMPGDRYLNTGRNPQANELVGRAMSAYRAENYQKALALIREAHEAAPEDSLVLYNLACFLSLNGEKEEALQRLHEAVEAGFYAPQKIGADSDLDPLRDDSRFEEVLALATDLALGSSAKDVVLNSTKSGRHHALATQAWEVYEDGEYEKGLELVQEAYELAPDDSRILYYLACFNALTGHKDVALDYLQRAVAGGFYSPTHIARDPDLESLRGTPEYEAVLKAARRGAAQHGGPSKAGPGQAMLYIANQVMDGIGVFDHIAEVHFTRGHTTWQESLVVLAPDAEQRPLYAVMKTQRRVTEFDRFLPKETMSFSVSGGIDLGVLLTYIEDTIRQAGPEGEELLVQWEGLQEIMGFNPREDVLSWLEGDFISVTLEDDLGSAWLIKVSDEEAAREKIDELMVFASEGLMKAAAQNPMLGMLSMQTMPVTDERLEGFQMIQLMIAPQQPIVWGTAQQHLIFGTSTDAVAMCLATARGDHPSIRENERVMGEMLLPDGPCTAVSLTDQRNLGAELADLMAGLSMASGFLTTAIPSPEMRPVLTRIPRILAKLTPVVRKIDFIKSTAVVSVTEGRYMRTRTITNYFAPGERAAQESAEAPATATP
jgi:tetratricopeptide (TPR) repeat protein